MAVRIGPARIADQAGTHEPGDVIESPSAALLELAQAKTLHPETGKPLVELLSDAKAAAAIAAAAVAPVAPEPTPATTPETP